MRKADVFDVWAPRESVWSPWAKPALFAHLPEGLGPSANAVVPRSLPHVPAPTEGTAVVLDLPGADAIPLALGFAESGYRPVPLYNAVPGVASAGEAVVDVRPIMDGLVAGASVLRRLAVAPDAPPVFLLDARRGYGSPRPSPGQFDNRSISLPTDFPSGRFLASRGVRRVLLVQSEGLRPQPDLAHTLLRYQEAGIAILSMSLEIGLPAAPIRVARPPFYRVLFHRLLATIGLRRSPLGGFGGTLPEPGGG